MINSLHPEYSSRELLGNVFVIFPGKKKSFIFLEGGNSLAYKITVSALCWKYIYLAPEKYKENIDSIKVV